MTLTKDVLIEKGWESIGFDGVLEYFAKEDEHGEIMYVPVQGGESVSDVRSMKKSVLQLLTACIE